MVRFAFIGYRDINDECCELDDAAKNRWRHRVCHFTDHLPELQAFLAGLDVGGKGEDVPEDVAGALQKVTELRWEAPVQVLLQ